MEKRSDQVLGRFASVTTLSKEHKCRQCGKRFEIPAAEMWVYKRPAKGEKYAYFCSWSCLRAWDRAAEEKRSRKDKENREE